MFKISKYVDSDKESMEVFPIELEINGKNSKTLGIEINGFLGDNDYTFRFIFSDIEKVFNDLQEIVKNNGKIDNPYRYLGLRREEK